MCASSKLSNRRGCQEAPNLQPFGQKCSWHLSNGSLVGVCASSGWLVPELTLRGFGGYIYRLTSGGRAALPTASEDAWHRASWDAGLGASLPQRMQKGASRDFSVKCPPKERFLSGKTVSLDIDSIPHSSKHVTGSVLRLELPKGKAKRQVVLGGLSPPGLPFSHWELSQRPSEPSPLSSASPGCSPPAPLKLQRPSSLPAIHR